MDGASSPPTAALAGSGLPGARALLSVSGRRLLGAQPGSAGSEVQGVAAWWVCSLMLSSAHAPDLHLLRFFAWFYSNCFLYYTVPISNIIQIRIARQAHDLQKLFSLP